MEQSPWEANTHSAIQEIPRLLWNPKFHFCVHKSRPLVPTLSQLPPLHIFPPYFPKVNSNITLPPTSRSSEWSFRFSNQNVVCISRLCHACYMSRLSHPPCCYHPNNIWWSLQVMKLPSLLQPPAASFLLGPNMLLSSLFSNALSLCSFHSLGRHVSDLYKTTGKIMFFYILFLTDTNRN